VVAVGAPAAGATVTSGRPTLSGTAAGDGGSVTMSIYSGSYSTVAPTTQWNVTPDSSGSWSTSPPAGLANGTYTVQATQPRGGVVGRSVPVTFTVSGQ
jgi:hypothetical protein